MYLILFDIDGTLCLTGRAGWRAMNRACQEVVGVDEAMANVATRIDVTLHADGSAEVIWRPGARGADPLDIAELMRNQDA